MDTTMTVSGQLSRRYFLTAIGTGLVTITGCIGTDGNDTETNDTEINGEPQDADFAVSDLSVDPSEVNAGDELVVTIDVQNTGGQSGNYDVLLQVNGERWDSKGIELEPDEYTTVEFTLTAGQLGSNSIEVNGLTANFDAVATEVGGIVQDDITWTVSESPYEIVETIQVPEDVTLTVEPGVTVYGSEDLRREPMFLLHGNIVAEGTAENMITFDGQDSNATFFDADGSPAEAFLSVEYAKIENGGSFWDGGNGGFHLRHSKLRNVDSSYVWYPYESGPGEIRIEYNRIIESGGFSVGYRGDVKVYIKNNTFKNCQESVYGGVLNNWRSYDGSEMIVEYNSFIDMSDVTVLKLPSGYNSAAMTAPENYWGTDDTETIESMIYDENDDIDSAGTIEYSPILEEPHSNTPKL